MEAIVDKIRFSRDELKDTFKSDVKWNYVGKNFLVASCKTPMQIYFQPPLKMFPPSTHFSQPNIYGGAHLDDVISQTFSAGYNNKITWDLQLFHNENVSRNIDAYDLRVNFTDDHEDMEYHCCGYFIDNTLEMKPSFDLLDEPEPQFTSEKKIYCFNEEKISSNSLRDGMHVLVVVEMIVKLNKNWSQMLPEELPIVSRYNLSLFNSPDDETDSKYNMKIEEQLDEQMPSQDDKKNIKVRFDSSIPDKIQDFRMLLEQAWLSDIILKVGEEKLATHKVILAARSAVFREMFCSDNKSMLKSIEINDFDCETVKNMLRFMYTGQVQYCDENCVKELLKISNKYGIYSLIPPCEAILLEYLQESNSVELLEFANHHHAAALKAKAIEIIVGNFDSIEKTKLAVLDKDLVMHILFQMSKK